MKELKSIDILSSGKISLMFGVFTGILMCLFILGFGSFFGAMSELTGEGEFDAASRVMMNFMALSYLIATPLMCFISGIIYAWLYNIAAKLVGGIKWEEREVPKS